MISGYVSYFEGINKINTISEGIKIIKFRRIDVYFWGKLLSVLSSEYYCNIIARYIVYKVVK